MENLRYAGIKQANSLLIFLPDFVLSLALLF
ncbi:hypothetical protein Ga0466249_002350 [Sporomusaceae bacterium BoRhaA]|nr:hypothetical protein [Pelorhabdus rhamnosifermentans]